jgi:hypothetical protein
VKKEITGEALSSAQEKAVEAAAEELVDATYAGAYHRWRAILRALVREVVQPMERTVATLTTQVHGTQVALVESEKAGAALAEALLMARGYIKAIHGSLLGSIGEVNIVSPDLARVDAALALWSQRTPKAPEGR